MNTNDSRMRKSLLNERAGALVRVAAALLLLAGCAPAWARYEPPAPCANKFSRDQELTEGKKVAAQVYGQMPVLKDSDPIAQYVAQLGARLAAHAPGYKWPYNYHVVASSEINAFALPGGAIFVNLGAVQAAESEAQLAGVLAHETSHVVLRHATCNLTKQQSRDVAYGIGGLLSEILLGNSVAGQLAVAGINGVRGLEYLHMSRDDEKQADMLGVNIMYDAGYDPRGMPQFFEIIQSKYGNGGAQFLSDHPNPGNRTEYIDQEIATLPRLVHPIVTSADFTRIHALAVKAKTFNAQQIKDGAWKGAGYSFGPGGAGQAQAAAPAAGTVTGSTAAALTPKQVGAGGSFATYRGSDYALSVPAQWQAETSSGNGVTLAPPGGSGTFGVSYGAVIGKAGLGQSGMIDSATLSAATKAIAQQLIKQNPQLRALGDPAPVQAGDGTGMGMEMQGVSPVVEGGKPLPERDWLVTAARPDGDVQYIVFVCPERDFGALRPVFRQIVQTLHFR